MESEKDPGTDYPTEESAGEATTVEKQTVETTERVETGGVQDEPADDGDADEA